MKQEYEQRVREQFPNLQYSEFNTLDNRERRLAIDDLSYTNLTFKNLIKDIKEQFILSCKGFIDFYEAEEIAKVMNNKLEDLLLKLNPKNTLLIFPGKGAQAVRDLLPEQILNYYPTINLEMCRMLSADMSVEKVSVLTGKNFIREEIPERLSTCILIDDVIASGSTAQAVKLFIDNNEAQEWYALSWMTLSPLQAKNRRKDDLFQSSLPGFRRLLTSVVYQGISGIPANNSLSSFADSGEKSEMVINGYKRKYVENIEVFDQIIQELRSLKNE